MGVKSNKIKSEQLGINVSTANWRLYKSILFHLAKQCGADVCYRCGEKIDVIEHFSVDHKEEWLHKPNAKELYFDLNNIAFSHLACNVAAQRKQKSSVGQTGYKGVSLRLDRGGKKYRAEIAIDGKKTKTIGYYGTPQEAAVAFDNASVEKYGDKAITNEKLGLL